MKNNKFIIGAVVAATALAVWGISHKATQFDTRRAERAEFCGALCAVKSTTMRAVKRQFIGYGSAETRCFCEDGQWHVIP